MGSVMTPPQPECSALDRRPCLVVDTPPSEDLTAQCMALGVDLRDGWEADDPPSAAIRGGTGAAETVRGGLSAPFCGFVELGAEGVLGIGLRCFETARSGGMTLSLQTGTVYRLETLELVAQAIRANFGGVSPDTADLIEISLAEALSNAVIHGNLGIPNHLRTSAEGFVQFQKLMHARLADPAMASRRIEINIQARGRDFLTISVSDQGAGFDLAEKLRKNATATAKSGRGLALIRKAAHSLHAEDGGRTLVMTFSR